MKIRGLILQGLLSIILVYLLFVPLGDANLIYLLFDEIPHQLNLPQYSFIIIFVIPFFVLIFTKNNKRTLLQIFAISQVIVLLITFILFICIFTHALYFLLMMGISLLQVFNVFFKSFKELKLASIITTSFFLLGLGVYSTLFWTVSRFDFELNEDGQSYSIVSIESDIPVVRIPSTYKGLPVTKISSNYYVYENIREIIFEGDSNIEIIEKNAFRCGNLRKIIFPSSLHSIGDNAFFECNSLEQVIIPIDVIYMGESVFYCPRATILCEAESRPDTWEVGWYYQYKVKEIIWGYGG
jgi:hypothetical protein